MLGLDPGYGRLGWGVVQAKGSQFFAVAYGVIETPAKTPFPKRLLALAGALEVVLAEQQPEEAAVETLFFSKNVRTAMQVAEARGVLRLVLARAGVAEVEIGPQQVKQAVTGDGRANKGQMQRMITRLLGLDSVPKPDDAADALALALAALQSAPLRRLTKAAQGKA